jgi:hypothetical protein
MLDARVDLGDVQIAAPTREPPMRYDRARKNLAPSGHGSGGEQGGSGQGE